MMEDFGDWGDEAFLGFCAEDWRDYLPDGTSWEERQRVRENLRRQQEEVEVDDRWDAENDWNCEMYDGED